MLHAFRASRVAGLRTTALILLIITRFTSVNVLAGVSRKLSTTTAVSWNAAPVVAETSQTNIDSLDASLPIDLKTAVADRSADALDQLTRVFGINHVPAVNSSSWSYPMYLRHQPHWSQHRTPPEYMMKLYNAVAYSDGISKTANPYEADIVRGISDKAKTDQVFYYFNMSHINQTEDVLEAELHLYKLRPTSASSLLSQQPRSRFRLQASHVVDVRIYEVLSDAVHKSVCNSSMIPMSDQLRLLIQRRVSAHRHGWEVFKIRNAVRRWVEDPSTNHGVLVTATTITGESVNGTLVRFAQRSEHHDSKQPVLIVFSDEDQPVAASSPDYMEVDAHQPPIVTGSNLRTMRRHYVNFLNEAFRAQHGTGPLGRTKTRSRRPNAYYMNPVVHQRLVNETDSLVKRPRREAGTASHHGVSRTGYHANAGASRRRKKTCQRHEMYVDFEKIGWSGWIISPKGYNAYQCRGVCPFPLGQNQHPSNHATVQSIVHALRIGPGSSSVGGVADGSGVDTPCCVPNKLYSISLLYFDDDENVILKQYDEMVAASCGCH